MQTFGWSSTTAHIAGGSHLVLVFCSADHLVLAFRLTDVSYNKGVSKRFFHFPAAIVTHPLKQFPPRSSFLLLEFGRGHSRRRLGEVLILVLIFQVLMVIVVPAASSDEESPSTVCFCAAVLTLRKIGVVDVGAD